MTPLYYVTLLDCPGAIDFGGSASESAAARIALRAANREQRDTCVVRSTDGEIVQRIRWKGLAVVEQEAAPEEPDRKYLSHVGLLEALDAARVWLDDGFTVTISPTYRSELAFTFNVVGRK